MQQAEGAGRAIAAYLMSGQPYDGLFIASLDHSPTEQLVGERWHTTALILSAAVEHSGLAHELATVANPKTRKLSKWSRSNTHYRKRFARALRSELARHHVLVLAISAEEATIAACESHFVNEFGASQHYRRFVQNHRERACIGPVVNATTGEKWTVEIPANQAPMVLFIAHFLRRMHQQMYVALSATNGAATYVTWQFYGDKPPGGGGGAFNKALTLLLGQRNPCGALRWGYFNKGDEAETDLLADNVAGLLNESLESPQRYEWPASGLPQDSVGQFYWERCGERQRS